jgi:G3E family GTPase
MRKFALRKIEIENKEEGYMSNMEIPILLLTGYLGSGKTTLVNHILSNKSGIKFAVIVNDIGEVNIDADLIQRDGIVGKKDESLVALQNGCICCTLKMDLIEQICEITRMHKFDYIVIEASGICEPAPIAQTICSIPGLDPEYTKDGVARLDCVVTVVDALRMQSEFACGDSLKKKHLDEDDIENLLIQQIEFCNMVILNKVSEVSPAELERIKQIIRALQPNACIYECDYANIGIEEIIHTGLFDFASVATSAGWIREIEKEVTEEQEEEAHHHEHHHHHDDDDDDNEHEHHHHHEHGEDCTCGCHHHHHHHDGEGEAEEYGIQTFVYYRRRPFNINKFDLFVSVDWPKSVIRAKGLCYFSNNTDMSMLFEQAGVQKKLTETGLWYATAGEEELAEIMRREPGLKKDWDEKYGDRMIKLVFIGQKMDKAAITEALDACLDEL